MKRDTKLRVLPFDYLKKIGRYDPRVHSQPNSPGYPKFMMQELRMLAEKREEVKFLENWPTPEFLKARYKYNKFIRIEVESSESQWVIPLNWVVRV